MKFNKFFRIFGVAIILSLLIAAMPAAPARAATYDVEIDPEEGPIGTEVTVYGDDFGWSEDTDRFVTIYFSGDEADRGDDIDDEVKDYEVVESSADVEEDDDGSFTTTIEIPGELNDGEDDVEVESGTYYLYFTLTSETATAVSTYIRRVVEFEVIGGDIEIDIEEGPVDTPVEITGEGFVSREDIVIEYDGDEIDIEDGDDETDSSGDFQSIIIIPESAAGDHTITITVGSSEAEVEFTVEPEILITPQSGEAGDVITVSGTGFDRRAEIEIWFADNIGVAVATASSSGSFTAEFPVPAQSTSGTDLPANIYNVDAEDGTNVARAGFTLTVPPPPTPPQEPTETPETPETPATPATPSTTTLSLSQESGYVGAIIIVGGGGFQPNATVTIDYDDVTVSTGATDATGTFVSNMFNVPASKHGDHKITASDGTNTNQVTFTVESVAPPIPQPLLPEMEVKVKSPIFFDWEDVTDKSLPVTYNLQIATDEEFTTNSLVLEKNGIDESGYTLTEEEELELGEQETPFYWRIRAVDAASNEGDWTGAGEFYVTTPFNFPNWALYTLLGIGAVIIFGVGYWLGRRTAFYY